MGLMALRAACQGTFGISASSVSPAPRAAACAAVADSSLHQARNRKSQIPKAYHRFVLKPKPKAPQSLSQDRMTFLEAMKAPTKPWTLQP